jgi:hypothetical protein
VTSTMDANQEAQAGTLDIEQEYNEEALAEMFAPGTGVTKRLWHVGPTYTKVGDPAPIGSIGPGLRKVKSQKNYPGNRVDFRGYWNTWWVQVVRDDQGHPNVWVSAVFFKEGANGKPVPGIPQAR